MNKMKLSQFNFDLPEELIAEYPSENRDEARLMVVERATGKIEHKQFKDIIDYIDEGDVLVMNNTKVFSSLPEALKFSNILPICVSRFSTMVAYLALFCPFHSAFCSYLGKRSFTG